MNRRDLLAALAAFGASAVSRSAGSQTPPSLSRLGVLSSGHYDPEQWRKGRFARRLNELGWVEGRNLVVERAYDDLVVDRLPTLAAELVRKRVDVVSAFGPEAALAAARATSTIPVVFWGVSFPVEQGLIDSYARPGRNVTGVAYTAGVQLFSKLFEILKELSPGIVRVAYFDFFTALRTVEGGHFKGLYREMESAAKSLRLELRSYPVSEAKEFDRAFKDIRASRAQALITLTTWFSSMERERIVDFVSRNRLVGVYDTKQFVEAGGLVSYGPDIQQMRERTANYVDRVLRGARPADLPVEQPTKFDLHVNTKAARHLGLTIPRDILVRADGVIR